MPQEICKEVELLVLGNENVRYFVFDSKRVVVEDITTSTPLLISRIKGRKFIIEDFAVIKEVCRILFGKMYSLKTELICGYPSIRSFRLYG